MVSLVASVCGAVFAPTYAPRACLPTLVAPVEGPIVGYFRAPDCTYCPGRRGVVFRSTAGSAVRAPVSGRLLFAGQVAGVLYVVIGDPAPTGLRVTVGRLESIAPGIPTVAPAPSGQSDPASPESVPFRVRAGRVLGSAGTTTWLGARAGARLGGAPIDPVPLLRRWRVALVPTGGGSVGCQTVLTPSGHPGTGRVP